MQRKNKVRFVALLWIPINCLIAFCLYYYFPSQVITFFHYSSFIFPAFFLAFFFTPLGGCRLNFSSHTKPKFSLFLWLLLLFLIEASFSGALLIQDQLNWIGMTRLQGLKYFMPMLSSMVMPYLGMNLTLFPWTFFSVLAASVAIVAVKASSTSPWSLQFFPRSNTFAGNEIRRVLELYVLLANRLFVVWTVVIISLFCAQLIDGQTITIYSLFHSMFIGGVLLSIFFGQGTKRLIETLEEKKVRQGILLMILGVIIILVTWVSSVMIESVAQHVPGNSWMRLLLRTLPFPQASLDPFFALAHWIFWIYGAPLFCALCIKVSEGRSVRQMMGGIILFPSLGIGLAKGLISRGISFHLQSPLWIYIPLIAAIVGFIGFCSLKNSHHYLRMGLASFKTEPKDRYLFFEPLIMTGIAFVALELILPLRGMVWLFTVVTLFGCWLIYLFVPLLTLLRKYRYAGKGTDQ